MLQRIHDSVGRWIALLLLGLVSAGFIFWGVNFGASGGAATFAAKVNGENLSLTEFDRELQARQNQYQQQYKIELSEDMRRELRRSVLEDLVRQAALRQRINDQGYRISDERLTATIRGASAFQVDGKFNMQTYVGLLQNQGMTPTSFEALQRESLQMRELQTGIADSTFLTPAEFRRYIELYNQRREVGYALFEVESFLPSVTVDEAAIAAHYESNKASYQTTETVDLEYIDLALADIAATIDVTDEALRAAYEEEKDRFQTAEERRARHILVNVAVGQEDAARTKAEGIVTRLRNGEDFAAVAKETSDDVGNKAQGGELGWVSHDMFPKPFEDALFGMQLNGVSDPVRTDFGYHIVQLEEIRAGTVQPFDAVREDLSTEFRTRRAEQQFYDRANQLEEKAFNAYNELTTVATELMLPVKKLPAFPRTGDAAAFTNSAPVVQAAFGEDVRDTGRNSPLVQLADDHVLVLRVTAHHAPADKPLEAVHDQIKDELARAKAQELSEKAADTALEAIQKGGEAAAIAAANHGVWHAPALIERTDANVPTEVLTAAFALPKPTAGPTREQVALANGSHAILVLAKVEPGEPNTVPQTDRDQRRRQLADQAALAELTSYVGNIREQATVRIPPDVLEPQF